VRNQARNDYGVSARHSSRGIVLIVFLAIILIAFTSIAISRLSENANEQKVRAKTTQALIQSRDAIMAFALNQPVPGTLPCPDVDGNGLSDGVAACTNRRGLVPFRSLNIPQPLDGSDTSIWYVVAQEYSGTISTPHNSSKASSLRLNGAQSMAFILLAPNYPFSAQVRTTKTPLVAAVTQYLEGENADGVADNDYTDIRDDSKFDVAPDTQNDQVLGMSVAVFWNEVEGKVLLVVGSALSNYKVNCGVYPFAALYSPGGNNDSSNGVLEGRVPLTSALPSNWGAACPAPFAANSAPALPPAWIANHWGDSLYYSLCPALTPNCLTFFNISGTNVGNASALVMSPGVPFAAWVSGNRNTFYELQNTSASDNNFTKNTRTGAFNDLIRVVP
jgi:hypothetical protein